MSDEARRCVMLTDAEIATISISLADSAHWLSKSAGACAGTASQIAERVALKAEIDSGERIDFELGKRLRETRGVRG